MKEGGLHMFIFIWELFIILLTSIALGAMPALKGRNPFPMSIIFFAVIAIVPISIGIVIGAAFFHWMAAFIIRGLVFIFALFIVIYFYRLYHPSYGYVPHHRQGNWFVLAGFFFLLGIEFASYGFSSWFIFLVIPLCTVGVVAGFIFMRRALSFFRYLSVIHFVPMGIFILVAIFQLI